MLALPAPRTRSGRVPPPYLLPRSRFLVVALVFLLSSVLSGGCDTQCVGPSCPDDDDDATTDDDDIGDDDSADDDDSGDDDDSSTPHGADERTPELSDPRTCVVTREHQPPTKPSMVQIAGEFSGWQPVDMVDPEQDGWWQADLGELAPGEYGYKYLYDGVWEEQPPPWALTRWNDGFENRNLRVLDCNRPHLLVADAVVDSTGNLFAQVRFLRASDGALLNEDGVQASVAGVSVPVSWDADQGLISITQSGLAPGKHSLRISASDSAGRAAENSPLFVPLWVEEEPFQWQDGLMYFAFTDRFRNGDWDQSPLFEATPGVDPRADYQGGDFLGVIDALQEDYFTDLGANVLWLSPVYSNPEGGFLGTDGVHLYSGYHGYWPTEARGVEERFGDAGAASVERLHELIDLAHSKGIRVLLDLVLNHVHQEHEYLVDHPDWMSNGCVCGDVGCDWDERALDCWFTDYLPDLNYRNHAIVQQVTTDVLWWIQEFDVDALRIDAAKHMDHVIMRTLRRRIEEDIEGLHGEAFYLVGETFSGADQHGLLMDYVSDYELHGQYDFPLFWGIRDAFIRDGSFLALEQAVQTGLDAWDGALMSPFLGNHDIPRFATEAAGNDLGPWDFTLDWMADGGSVVNQWDLINRQSMAFAFTLTQPGVPLIYYGDEIGLAGSGDPDNRRMMSFDSYLSANQAELLGRVRAIGQARAGSEALRRGQLATLWVDDDLWVYSLTSASGDVALVAMNKAWDSRTQTVAATELAAAGVTQLQDLLHPERQLQLNDGAFEITLGSWEYALLLPLSE